MRARPGSDPAIPRAALAACVAVLAAISAAIPASGEERHSQKGDAGFDPRTARPAYTAGEGPVVCIDEAHENFHTMDGRYSPFTALLQADGYRVVAATAAFSAGTLEPCRILVIANARGSDSAGDVAFTPAEIEAVDRWVRSGGSLLLIADHAPFGAAAADLGSAFGVEMHNGHAKDPGRMDAKGTGPYILRFEENAGLAGDHPITRGRTPEEKVRTVVTFGGQALRAGPGGGVLLVLSESALSVPDPRNPEAGRGKPVAGWAHAVARPHGEGRVMVAGEAALFTAQVIRGPVAKSLGLEEFRVGMTREDTDNRQFVLNTLHWLSGLL